MKETATLKNPLNLTLLIILFLCSVSAITAQNRNAASGVCNAASGLSGMYQIDAADSDRLYSVIESATTKIPFGKQQQFFMDLAVRLTPPDLLAIECRGYQVSLGSSRAPRISFKADGITRNTRTSDGRVVQSRIGFERDSLIFNSGGANEDKLSFTFTPLDNGTRLKVTRQITAEELIEPVIIQTVYNKIDEVAHWNIYGEKRIAGKTAKTTPRRIPPAADESAAPTSRAGNSEANDIRQLLNRWIDATNRRDIEKQMSYYMPELEAYYLARNASRNSVRLEKIKAFATAESINIRVEQPEIIFQENGQTAVMRFRKKYRVENHSKIKSGEVIQELRWKRTNSGWKIFSERDIRVLS